MLRCRKHLHGRRFGRLQEVDSFSWALSGSDTPQSLICSDALFMLLSPYRLDILAPDIKQILKYTSYRQVYAEGLLLSIKTRRIGI